MAPLMQWPKTVKPIGLPTRCILINHLLPWQPNTIRSFINVDACLFQNCPSLRIIEFLHDVMGKRGQGATA